MHKLVTEMMAVSAWEPMDIEGLSEPVLVKRLKFSEQQALEAVGKRFKIGTDKPDNVGFMAYVIPKYITDATGAPLFDDGFEFGELPMLYVGRLLEAFQQVNPNESTEKLEKK